MLRTSLPRLRPIGSRAASATVGRQWRAAGVQSPVNRFRRHYADDKAPVSEASKPAVVPSSETRTAESSRPPAAQTSPTPTTPAANVPLTPPAPSPAATKPDTSIATSVAAPPPPPPPQPPATTRKPGFFRRLRNYALTITILTAVLFGGGVWYSRVNDNFHDFFTEYVPFGELAVLYLEEMDFRKRFPHVTSRINSRPREASEAVKIPAKSGASPRVASMEPSKVLNKTEKATESVQKASEAKEAKETAAPAKSEKSEAGAAGAGKTPSLPTPEQPEKPVGGAVPVVAEKLSAPAPPAGNESTPKPKASKETGSPDKGFKPPEVDEPSRWPPASPIDPLTVDGAREPLVQDLVRMLNDIITVINADGANEKYASTIGKAKNELRKVGRKIKDIKAQVEKDAAKQVRLRVDDFDKAANDLISRVEAAMTAQETEWRHEFEAEMAKLKETYDERLKLIADRERRIGEEKANNKLLQQALEMKRQFADEVKSQVEAERDGRLGRLGDLSMAVTELEKLTTGWNSVIDTTAQTQQLLVAVDALKARLEDPQNRRFVAQLAAVKEVAWDDAVVGAAVASINPAAYHRGLPTTAELVDRFRRVAGEVRKAALLPDNAGVASHASSWVLSHVLFRKQGLAAGDDVESILTRTQTYLEEGDLDNAAREMNGLTGWAKTLSRDWLGEVRKVLEVQQAVDVISTEARLQSLRVE